MACWVVQIPVRGRCGSVKYDRHEFKTKAEDTNLKESLNAYSELYHSRKKKV